MRTRLTKGVWLSAALLAMFLAPFSSDAQAGIRGHTGPTFNLTVKDGYVTMADGGVIYMWGYALPGGEMQYPGPTLIVNQGDVVTIDLTNELAVAGAAAAMPSSIVFPGMDNVTATCVVATCGAGLMTTEAPADGLTTVRYSFTADRPGTFQYHSGTRPDLQVEMGLVGAIIVRPTGFVHADDEATAPDPGNQIAYNDSRTAYDHEYLYVLTEVDMEVHDMVLGIGQAWAATGGGIPALFDWLAGHEYKPVYWFVNGRGAFDTLVADGAPWLPSQPYGSLARAHPGQTLLLRMIGAGRDLHPFHTHGNNFTTIGRDANLLESASGLGPDLGWSDFTQLVVPGQTTDALWSWSDKGLGFDIYGHAPGDGMEPGEDPANHGNPLPTSLPQLQDTTFGGFYSGSPFLGSFGDLPPGEGGLNLDGGLFFMWHSHNELELVNNDIFPGGMLTMLIVEPRTNPDGDPVTIPRGSQFED